MIFVEDLNLEGMLGKHILDAGFGQFLSLLSWVCWKCGVSFHKVDPADTSQVCRECEADIGKDL
jgi:putative transposase